MVMNSAGRARVLGWAAALGLMFGMSMSVSTAQAQTAGHIRIVTQQGPVDIAVASVVAADLNGDAMADREASAPSVSEIRTAREQGSGMATGKVRESPTLASTGQTSLRESPTKQSTGKTSAQDDWSPNTRVSGPRDAQSGMASGKRMHKPFVITKEIDKASPLLGRLAASGAPIPEVDVELPQGGAGMRRYVLQNVMVSSIQSVGGGDRPMESISFTYQKIEMK